MLSSCQQELLCVGYTRLHYSNINKNNIISIIPVEINEIIRLYWNENIILTKLDGPYLKSFLSSTSLAISGDLFKIHECIFQCCLSTNGHNIMYRVNLKTKPPHITSITLYSQFYCVEMDCYFKISRTMYDKDSYSSSWFLSTLSVNKCRNKESLTFVHNIELTRVIYAKHYKDCHKIYNYYKPIKMNIKNEFYWDLQYSLPGIQHIINGHAFRSNLSKMCQYVLSPNSPDNCFFFWVHPSSENKFGLSLIYLPPHIKTIQVKASLSSNQIQITKKFEFDANLNIIRDFMTFDEFGWSYVSFQCQEQECKLIKCKSIKCKIKILKVVTFMGKEIDRNEWKNHGFVEYM
eukprot:173206_1